MFSCSCLYLSINWIVSQYHFKSKYPADLTIDGAAARRDRRSDGVCFESCLFDGVVLQFVLLVVTGTQNEHQRE